MRHLLCRGHGYVLDITTDALDGLCPTCDDTNLSTLIEKVLTKTNVDKHVLEIYKYLQSVFNY